jgi:protein SCO1
MNTKQTIYGLIALGLILFMGLTAFFFRQATRETTLPIYGQVSDFRLTDVNQKDLSLNDLRDKIWVANFFFTTCSDICPIMTKNMAALHRSYKLLDDVAFVSVTVNPENDTADALAKYAKTYEADAAKWHFLTGTREAITDLMVRGFKLSSLNDPVFHSSFFALVDRKGQIRGYYDGTSTEKIQQLFKDLALLTKEKRH